MFIQADLAWLGGYRSASSLRRTQADRPPCGIANPRPSPLAIEGPCDSTARTALGRRRRSLDCDLRPRSLAPPRAMREPEARACRLRPPRRATSALKSERAGQARGSDARIGARQTRIALARGRSRHGLLGRTRRRLQSRRRRRAQAMPAPHSDEASSASPPARRPVAGADDLEVDFPAAPTYRLHRPPTFAPTSALRRRCARRASRGGALRRGASPSGDPSTALARPADVDAPRADSCATSLTRRPAS